MPEKKKKPQRLALLKKTGIALAVLLFWLAVWQIAAIAVRAKYKVDFILPTVPETVRALIRLIPTAAFAKAVLSSVLRILAGFLFGCVLAILLAFLTHYVRIAERLIAPVMTVIRATPVASFIMVLWILLDERSVPSAIAILMVMPVIWQNLSNGFSAQDGQLGEVLTVFGASPIKRFRLLTLPALIRYLIPGILTSVGLAWKAGIAAEIIAYTKNSIGSAIKNAKDTLETPTMFAWTLCVILLSLVFEKAISMIARRYEKTKKEERP